MPDFYEFHCPKCRRYTKTTARWLAPGQDLWCKWCGNVYQVEYKIIFSAAEQGLQADGAYCDCLFFDDPEGVGRCKNCLLPEAPRR